MKLEAIIRVYVGKPRRRAQEELNSFRQQPSVRDAVEKAALAVNSEGKRYKHQRRIKRVSLEQARLVLPRNLIAIERVRDFDQLHALLDGILRPISGIGKLYVYDAALRIGAKLGLLPSKVYLHAGTRAGARALGLNVRSSSLEVSALPREFHVLPAHEIEDILCIFKDKFRSGLIKSDIDSRSWCG